MAYFNNVIRFVTQSLAIFQSFRALTVKEDALALRGERNPWRTRISDGAIDQGYAVNSSLLQTSQINRLSRSCIPANHTAKSRILEFLRVGPIMSAEPIARTSIVGDRLFFVTSAAK